MLKIKRDARAGCVQNWTGYIQTVAKSGNAVVRWLREYDFPPRRWGKMMCLIGTSCDINLRGSKKNIPRRLIHAEYAKGESEKRELQKTLSEVATTAGGVWKVQK